MAAAMGAGVRARPASARRSKSEGRFCSSTGAGVNVRPAAVSDGAGAATGAGVGDVRAATGGEVRGAVGAGVALGALAGCGATGAALPSTARTLGLRPANREGPLGVAAGAAA